MAAVTNEHGSFAAPDGWTELPELGAVDRPADEVPDPKGPRASVILTGDALPEGRGRRAYLDAQKAMVSQVLDGWQALDESVTEEGDAASVLRHAFQAPEGWMVQYQAYWFRGERVSILTMTAPSADANPAWERFVAAMASFAAP